MKKTTLSLSLALLLQASASALAQTPPPQTSVVQTTVTTAPVQNQVQNQNVLQPRPTPSSPNAVNALQQTIQTTTQTVVPGQAQGTVLQQAQPAGAASGVTLPNFESTDESTLLREASKYQARLNFMQMVSKINKAQLDIEREKLKFENEKLKAEEDNRKLSAPQITSPSLNQGLAAIPGASGMSGGVMDIAMEIDKPVVRSIYSYDGTFFAEIMTGSSKTIAKSGSSLPSGDKVISIRDGVVVISRRGKRMILGVDQSSSMTASSSSASSSAAPRASAPSSLPPLPPGGVNP